MFLDSAANPRVHFLSYMRRSPLCLAFSGLELARFFVLANATERFVSAQPGAPQLLRLLAAPNVLFALGFFFLGLDVTRYAPYRTLLAVGKVVSLLSGAIAAPRLVASIATSAATPAYAILGIAAWDALTGAYLAFGGADRRAEGSSPAGAAPQEPERVELD